MRIFVTGVTGYIGGSIAKQLVDEGHTILGLVRNRNKIDELQAIGIKPIVGTLEDEGILIQSTQSCEAVINAANADHRESVDVFVKALHGTGKTFIHTSGSSVIGDDALGEFESEAIYNDDSPFTPISIREKRAAINNFVRIAGVKDGFKAMVITPPMIYGDALGLAAESDQLPKLIKKSEEKKAGIYLGKGLNRWSNVHIKDLAVLYSLVLKRGPSAAMYFAENGENSLFEIAQSISHALGFGGKTISWSIDEAIQEFGDWARFALGSNSRVRAVNARNLLGWMPRGEPMLSWIEKSVMRL